MYDNYNFPEGADTPDAPWNQKDTPEINVNVQIEQTLTLDTTIVTTSYNKIADEDSYYIEYNDNELSKEALEQIITPSKILETIPEIYNELLNSVDSKYLTKLKIVSDACKEWIVVNEEVNRI